MKHKTIFFLIIIIFFSTSIYIATNYNLSLGNLYPTTYTIKDNSVVLEDCDNLSLTDSAECVRDYVKTFYNYNITDEKYYDLKTLKEKGGDCYNYAMYYDAVFRDLGFNSKTIHIENGEIDHRITIISNEEGYCIIDMLNIHCMVI